MSEPDLRAPLVSILTPSFNQATWLDANLASVQSQTYPRIEHIVMDGGSWDGTVEILERQPASVRWHSESDRGQSHALNKAYFESTGEIIGWLNSDDAYWAPHVVESVVRGFAERPDVDVLYGHAALINASGLVLQVLWVPPFNANLLKTTNFIYQPAAFIRRDALDAVMAREEYDYSMDRELWLRLLMQGKRFARYDRILAVDRHHPARKSVTRTDLAAAERQRLGVEYAIRHGGASAHVVMGKNALSRLFGLRFATEAAYASAPWLISDGLRALARRQIAMRRRRMPGTVG